MQQACTWWNLAAFDTGKQHWVFTLNSFLSCLSQGKLHPLRILFLFSKNLAKETSPLNFKQAGRDYHNAWLFFKESLSILSFIVHWVNYLLPLSISCFFAQCHHHHHYSNYHLQSAGPGGIISYRHCLIQSSQELCKVRNLFKITAD